MAASHSQRKTTVKQLLSLKKILRKKPVSQKKPPELKQGKQEQKKLAMRQLPNVKDPQHPSAPTKTPQQLHQKKGPLLTKGNGKTVSLGKNVHSNVSSSSQAKCAKLGRNLCTLTSEELQQELNEMMMHKQMTRTAFANNLRVPH